jgi:sialic acid synthase SpsE
MSSRPDSQIFENLFVLELANNHWGNLDRGLKIIRDFSRIVRFNNVHAAIKLQFRDVDNFIHQDWRHREDIRYIKKTLDTQLSKDELRTMVEAVRNSGCVTCATPFDEASVEMCVEFGVDVIKIASSDISDWFLIERIAKTRKPVIFSTGGSSLKDIDDMVTFFERRQIPMAINHCVSIYPSEDSELELNQVDFLKRRYPDHVIGYSTHEHTDWTSSVMMAYAKGARTFERHIDIEADGIPVSAYCTLPHQADEWFKAYQKAREMCGGAATERRALPNKEVEYLDALVRGVYAKRDLAKGTELTDNDVYLAIPLQKGQISAREFMRGEVIQAPMRAHEAIHIDDVDSPYAENDRLKRLIYDRGFDPENTPPSADAKKAAEADASKNGHKVERDPLLDPSAP